MGDAIRDLLTQLSDDQIDASMIPLLKGWAEPPTALQVLEVLDKCIHGSLASGFVVTVLEAAYDQALAREATTHEAVVQGATWRTPRPTSWSEDCSRMAVTSCTGWLGLRTTGASAAWTSKPCAACGTT